MKKILLFIMSMIFVISFSSCKNGDTPNDGVPQGIQTSTAQIYGDDVVNTLGNSIIRCITVFA